MKKLLGSVMLAVFLLGARPAPTAFDLWYRHYEFGLRAIEQSDWVEAIRQFNEAIERRDEPSQNARTYRMRFIDYFPYYHLGVAYYSMGQTARAKEFFEQEMAFGEVQKSELYGSQIRTMMVAVDGPRGSVEVINTAAESQRRELRAKLDEGVAHYEAGRYRQAVSAMAAVLAIAPENEEATRILSMARREALRAEVAQLTIEAPELNTSGLGELMGFESLDAPALEPEVPVVEGPVFDEPEVELATGEATPTLEEGVGLDREQEEVVVPVVEAPPEEQPAEEAPAEGAAEAAPAGEAPAEEAAAEAAPAGEAGAEGERAPEAAAPPAEEAPPAPAQPTEAEVAEAEAAKEAEEAQGGGDGVSVTLPTPAVPVPVPVPVGGGDDAEAEDAAEESAPTASAAATLESLAWTFLEGGKELAAQGEWERAQAKFVSVLTMLETPALSANTVLLEEAQAHYDAVQEQIRLKAEARRQQEIARLNAEIQRLSQTKPEVAVLSPPILDEPYYDHTVKVQGVVVDDHGIEDVVVEVNGQVWGKPEIGLPTRNISVSSRTAADTTLGTQVNFHQDITLNEGDNEIVIRARNVLGLETEQKRNIRREERKRDIWAAVIGVSEYQDESIPDLEFATADAQAFYEYLVEDLNVPEDHIYKLMDTEVTAQRMREVLGEDIRNRADPEDMVIIYYAGHGAPEADPADPDGDGAEKYLVPWDASPDRLFSTAFSMSMVSQIFARIRAETILFVSDACYSGAAGEGRTFGSGTASRISDNYMNRIGGTGRLILTASSSNQLSHERRDLGHGVFTYHLLDGLDGPADTNKDGLVTLLEAYEYVTDKVPADTGNRQRPLLKGDLGGRIVLRQLGG